MIYYICPKCNKKGFKNPSGDYFKVNGFSGSKLFQCKYCNFYIYLSPREEIIFYKEREGTIDWSRGYYQNKTTFKPKYQCIKCKELVEDRDRFGVCGDCRK